MQYFVEACHRINKKNGKKCFWARIEDIMANPRKVFERFGPVWFYTIPFARYATCSVFVTAIVWINSRVMYATCVL